MKNFDKKKILNNLNLFLNINSNFWFGDFKENTESEKDISKSMLEIKVKSLSGVGMENKENLIRRDKKETVKDNDSNMETLKKEDFKSVKNLEENKIPAMYIKLFLEDININQLFLKHNITLKYIEIIDEELFKNSGIRKADKYIKSFILGNMDREIDCYSNGENESLIISKQNASITNITLQEKSGTLEKIIVVNGVIID